jgi:hypothetical protein
MLISSLRAFIGFAMCTHVVRGYSLAVEQNEAIHNASAAGSYRLLHNRDDGTVGNGIALRILPIGDPITAGFQSSDNYGYRRRLERYLNGAGNPVTYIGRRSQATTIQTIRTKALADSALARSRIESWPMVFRTNILTSSC